MDENWTRKAAHDAAVQKVREARVLLEEAKSIFHSNDYDVDKANAGEAIVYIDEILED
jgi:hypothetical protein